MPPRKAAKRETSDSGSSEDNTPPPAKVKKQNKKDSENESDNEEQGTHIPAIDFIDFIEDFNKYGKQKIAKLRGKPDMAKVAEQIPELQKYHDLYSQLTFNSDFNALFVTSARRKNTTVDTVLTVMNRYLHDGPTVEHFPNFPKAPSRPINAYISRHRDVDHASLEDIVKLRKEFASGSINTKPYFDKYAEECKVYIEKLRKYMEKYSDRLREPHIDYINNVITRITKANDPKQGGGSSQKRVKKEKKTAFQWFKDANPDLYADKDEETRDRKLQRKFDKLDESEKRIYENIAAKNS